MTLFSLRTLFVASAIAALLAPPLPAQSTRPGGTARANTGTTANRGTTARNTGASNTSRSSTGQRQYRSNTELGDAVIQIDPETRSLVIVTDEETHRELMTVIKTLDKPKPQVLIKVVFIEVTYNKGIDVGLEGNYNFNLRSPGSIVRGQGAQTTTTVTNTGTAATGTTQTTTAASLNAIADTAAAIGQTAMATTLFGAPTTGAFFKAMSDDWTATLHALSTKGKVEVLSRPSIMARNNQEAVIVVGSEVPFITDSRTTDLGATINTIRYDNVGIILRVTPFITSEGTVEMIVAPEISTLNKVDTVPISNTVNAPTIDKRSAETVVVTPHGQTVVIGGLMETRKTESVSKIPILGDIPILGIPFRRTIRDDRKRELLIFLTPYIVNNSTGATRVAADELARTEFSKQTFNKPEFEKYLDDLPLPTDGAKAPEKQRFATPIPVKKVSTKQTTTTVTRPAPARRP